MATSLTVNMCSRLLRTFSGLSSARIQTCVLQRHSLRRLTTATEKANGSNSEGDPRPPPPPTGDEAKKAEAKLEEMQKSFDVEKGKLQEEISDYKDKYTRSLAESENVRQRMQKQVADAKLFGIQGFCKDLLEVADILQAATDAVPAEQLQVASNPHLVNLHQGLTMTEHQLQKVFVRNGLVKINPDQGERFDPHQHEALFQQPAPEGLEANTVAVVTKIGYNLNGRTIRPAIVGVFK